MTSCTFGDTKWVRGSGPPIRSWLKSAVHVFEDSHLDKTLKAKVKKDAVYASMSPTGEAVGISQITMDLTWAKFGDKAYDGWLYGRTDDEGYFTGDNITYVYDDLTTVIHGKFHEVSLLINLDLIRI